MLRIRHVAPTLAALALLTWTSLLGAVASRAHEGHDHDSSAAPAGLSQALPRAESHSDEFELVAVAEGTVLTLYLDSFATNEPVAGATVEVETPTGPQRATGDDGVYRLDAPWLAGARHFDLIVTVTAGERVDVLPVTLDSPAPAVSVPDARGASALLAQAKRLVEPASIAAGVIGLLIGIGLMAVGGRRRTVSVVVLALLASTFEAGAHEGHDHGADDKPAVVSGDRAARLPDGSVFVPKPIQRIFGLRTLQLVTADEPRTVEMPGRIIPDPNSSGFVQTAVGGRLAPPPGGFPQLGASVKAGDVLATIVPPLQAIDVSDLSQRQGELDQQMAIVERRLKRFETLAPSGAIARSQLEETKLELDGLRDRRAALDRVRVEPVPLVAPVNGIIAEGTPVAGQIAQNNAVIFHIVDPQKLWVEALSFETLSNPGKASARTSGGTALSLAFRGAGFTDRSQSIPIHFAVETATTGLRAGQFVTVLAETGERRSGLAVPRSAVIRASNGQDIVFEHTSAERFDPRPVRIAPLDAERVLIVAGSEAGRRVVTRGAELLDHVR